MEYVNVGTAGVKVSRIALGLGLREQRSADEAERVIEHVVDSGINFIDCANRYGIGDDKDTKRGTSEEVFGRVLRTRRDDVVIGLPQPGLTLGKEPALAVVLFSH